MRRKLRNPSCDAEVKIEYSRYFNRKDSDEAFEAAKAKILGQIRQGAGIGTLGEKTLHAIMKNYFEPDADFHEVALEGYFADIFNSNGVIEIQTRSFGKMREKLTAFLEVYPVTIVYPLPFNKWISWIDNETGETSPPRKSPKKGTVYDAFRELYAIKPFLCHPNLNIILEFVDIEEYRLLNGWSSDRKKGSTRYDRIPVTIREEIIITQPEDYMQFVPFELESPFTSKEFAAAAKTDSRKTGTVINILLATGVIKRNGKSGRSYLYEVTSD